MLPLSVLSGYQTSNYQSQTGVPGATRTRNLLLRRHRIPRRLKKPKIVARVVLLSDTLMAKTVAHFDTFKFSQASNICLLCPTPTIAQNRPGDKCRTLPVPSTSWPYSSLSQSAQVVGVIGHFQAIWADHPDSGWEFYHDRKNKLRQEKLLAWGFLGIVSGERRPEKGPSLLALVA